LCVCALVFRTFCMPGIRDHTAPLTPVELLVVNY
jgi:hypothetical protein